MRNILVRDSFGKAVVLGFALAFGLNNLFFKRRNNAVLKFARAVKLALAFGNLHFNSGLVQLVFQNRKVSQSLFIGAPFVFQTFGFFL